MGTDKASGLGAGGVVGDGEVPARCRRFGDERRRPNAAGRLPGGRRDHGPAAVMCGVRP